MGKRGGGWRWGGGYNSCTVWLLLWQKDVMWMGALRREWNACVMCQICSERENGSHLNFCVGLFQSMTGSVAKLDIKKIITWSTLQINLQWLQSFCNEKTCFYMLYLACFHWNVVSGTFPVVFFTLNFCSGFSLLYLQKKNVPEKRLMDCCMDDDSNTLSS